MNDLQSLINPLKTIAKQAGALILEIYEQPSEFDVQQKGDRSPLTRADQASNALICSELQKLTPDIPIISEENIETPYEERRHWTRCWLVDPLDGTKEFIKRNGDFTINIALVENGSPVAGVVYAPVWGELFWAVKGGGAFLQKENMDRPIEAAVFRNEDAGLNLVCSRSHLTKETEAFIVKYREPNLVSRGSSLKFLMLAKGDAHVYPRIAPTMEWDTGAAQIILQEAGGQVLHFETRQPLTYNKENLRNPAFLALGQMLS
jgi:3'(2'), 5'-bisphosphate nucleotidase